MENKEKAIQLLIEKAAEIGHNPKKSDFTAVQTAFLKSSLGPWPRALEEAGLKEKRDCSALEKNRIKRNRKKKERRKEKRKE